MGKGSRKVELQPSEDFPAQSQKAGKQEMEKPEKQFLTGCTD